MWASLSDHEIYEYDSIVIADKKAEVITNRDALLLKMYMTLLLKRCSGFHPKYARHKLSNIIHKSIVHNVRQYAAKAKGKKGRFQKQHISKVSFLNKNTTMKLKSKTQHQMKSAKVSLNTFRSFLQDEQGKAIMKRIPFAFLCYFMCPIQIISPVGISMIPTMAPRGEIFLVDKYIFRLLGDRDRRVKVGDIILTRKPSLPESSNDNDDSCSPFPFLVDTRPRVMKRVMAIGKNNDFDINSAAENTMNKTNTPPDSIWIEGDNQDWSTDSRHYGPIKTERIEGKLIMRIWPLTKFGRLSQDRPYIS